MKTKEECLLRNGIMRFDLGKNAFKILDAMDEYAESHKQKMIPVEELERLIGEDYQTEFKLFDNLQTLINKYNR